MPYLILTPLWDSSSRKLRLAATESGWEVLRLENQKLPNWFEIEDNKNYVIRGPAVKVFDVAKLLSVKLLCCDAYWMTRLPQQIVKRNMYITTIQKALEIKNQCFVKPALGKFFRSGVYTQKSLLEATRNVPRNMLVNIQEPVTWSIEYRCFIVEKKVVSVSSYFSNSQLFFNASNSELTEAKKFANSIFEKYDIDTPPSFTLDIGIIKNSGWAVVESNEAWAAGIYSCNPSKVLKALLKASIPQKKFLEKHKNWDAEENFLSVFSEPFYSLDVY